MNRFIEFPLEGGGSVMIEAEPSGPVMRGLRPQELPIEAGQTFEAALDRVSPAALGIVERWRRAVDPPDEIDIEFGIQLSAEVGAFVAKATGDANFRVVLRWKRDAPPSV